MDFPILEIPVPGSLKQWYFPKAMNSLNSGEKNSFG